MQQLESCFIDFTRRIRCRPACWLSRRRQIKMLLRIVMDEKKPEALARKLRKIEVKLPR
jgi:hypothetical protein